MRAPDPVAFSIFGIDAMWYGILISMGFMLAIYMSYMRADKFGIKPDYILDFAIILVPAAIIGARLYYVIFRWDYYQGNIAEIINIRNGGLAIHGGIIFGIIAGALVCKYRKINMLNLADLVFPAVALAQSIGRWGNFFNSEAHGVETDLPWAVIIEGRSYHPTFLYESLFCFALFFFLIWMSKRSKFVGQIALLYGILYSAERFFVEGLRTDSLMLGELRIAQVVSVTVIATCLIAYYILSKKGRKR
ncbi:prolipoprotein diacylglyceryl transferase [Eubacteriales bacterium KG127]